MDILAGNELLGNYGKTGRDFFNLLLNCDLFNESESPEQELAVENSLLKIIQNSIKENSVPQTIPESVATNDKSISFHNVHNINREVEVLYENILKLITDPNEDITPKDIIVMTPDITSYAPYIKAVFE
jgi:exodeoxyribonuclease V gamma subunit